MGSEAASAEADRDKAKDSRPPALEEKREGTSAAAAAGSPTAAPPGVRAKSVVGPANDAAERKADESAERVLRMPDPSKVPAAGPAPTTPQAGSGPPEAIKRAADPAAQQRVPGTPAVKPVGTGSAGGTGPDTSTPAGPAPLVSPPIAAGAKPAESATPAPDPEPPAAEGEAPARGTPAVSPELQDYLDASRGKGAPLPDGVRKEFEARFQRPFADVRVHDDAGADNAARAIDALAFTRGSDIYFRSGAYDPTSEPGRRLLAHELAHVVQNRPGINRKAASSVGPVIRRKKDTKPAPTTVPDDQKGPTWTAPSTSKVAGTINTAGKGTLSLTYLPYPKWKAKATGIPGGPYGWRHDKRGATPQRENWKAEVKTVTTSGLTTKLAAKGATKAEGEPNFLKLGAPKDRSRTEFFIGSMSEIADIISVPVWTREGKFALYDVEHKIDWQLSKNMGGSENNVSNLWLFNRSINRAEGFRQAARISRAVNEFMDQADPYLKPKPRRNTVLTRYDVTFGEIKYDLESVDGKETDYWHLNEMGKELHVAPLVPLTPDEVADLKGEPGELRIFTRAGGGRVRNLKYDPVAKKPLEPWQKEVKKDIAFQVSEVHFTSKGPGGGNGDVGSITGWAFKGNNKISETEFEVGLDGLPGLPNAAVLSKSRIKAQFKAKGLSPIALPDLEFDPFDGFVGRGKILPTPNLLKNVDVDLVIGGGIAIEALITAGNLELPGPFQVTGGALLLHAGTNGLAVEGRIDFEIEKLARGYVQAAAEHRAGTSSFELEGALDFDTKMFDKAHLELWYRDSKWGIKGELAVDKPDKIKGIKKASAKVEISDDTVTAAGEFEPMIKGIQKGTLGFKYNEATGMEINGEILIGKGIPGIKSGKLGATIKEGPETHSLSAEVTLEPDIPGVTGNATGRYDDGAFAIDAQLGYEHGFAKGTVHLGVTNQAVGADGKPAGEPKKDGSLTVWGDGQVKLQLTPWLVGTVGLKLTPDGQVEVSGEVALPPTFTVFDEKKIEKTLLAIHVDIPIVGVAVAGQRIGIFATIGGSLKVDAGIGPGVLRDVALKVSYNPAKPEATTVTGNATFAIPAHAGLRLTVEGAVGASIPVVSAKAGVQVYGEIGVAGEASAGALVTWSPAAGVVLDAKGEIFVEPKFKFGIDAFVDVSADLWVTEVELYHETWHLAAFEYGSNLRFGLSLPIHYESQKPFDISFDQIQWTYPHIEPKELIGGLVKQIVG